MADSFVLRIPAAKVPIVQAEAKAQGVDLQQAYGALPENHGVVLDYQVTYVDGSAVVAFTVKKKPFIVPVSAIEDHVKALIGI